jgi:phosphoglycerate dehydrogenase-like enzyme
MRVLVADRLSEDALDEMRGLGVEVEYDPRIDGPGLAARLDDVNVLFARGTEVTAEALAA